MKKTTVLLFAAIFLLGIAPIQADEPFAPRADIPRNHKNDPEINLAIMFLKNVKIPTKQEVGVPAYPGSKIIQTDPGAADRLAMVRLLVIDPPEKVLAFYKKALTDWKYKDFYGTHSFFKGSENDAMMGKTPAIQIASADLFKKSMPAAKTTIGIWFKAGK